MKKTLSVLRLAVITLVLVLAASFIIPFFKLNASLIFSPAEEKIDVPQINPNFSVIAVDYKIEKNVLRVSYALKELLKRDRNITSNFSVFDATGKLIAKANQTVVLGALQNATFRVAMFVPQTSRIRLYVNLANGNYTFSTMKEIGFRSWFTGFVVAPQEATSASSMIIPLAVMLFVVYLVINYLYKHQARVESILPKKRFIPLNLS